MSKLTRTVLKEIVKECIVEIFEESFFNPNASLVNENKTIRKNRRSNDSTQRSKRPTKPAQQSKQQKSYFTYPNYNIAQHVRAFIFIRAVAQEKIGWCAADK